MPGLLSAQPIAGDATAGRAYTEVSDAKILQALRRLGKQLDAQP
jgi:hypothetical protein